MSSKSFSQESSSKSITKTVSYGTKMNRNLPKMIIVDQQLSFDQPNPTNIGGGGCPHQNRDYPCDPKNPMRVVHFTETFKQQNQDSFDDNNDDDDDDDDGDDDDKQLNPSTNYKGDVKKQSNIIDNSGDRFDPNPRSASTPASSSSSSTYLHLKEPMIARSSPTTPTSGLRSSSSQSHRFPTYSKDVNRMNDQQNSGGSTTTATTPTPNWKFRAKFYSKRRGQERSIDRERQPSICSDSETDSLCSQNKIESLISTPGGQGSSVTGGVGGGGGGGTTKKWSLPLPVVIRSSESDSASSSWSARSADEATEDERSPVPSPSASTYSTEEFIQGSLSPIVSSSSTTSHSISIETKMKKMYIESSNENDPMCSTKSKEHRSKSAQPFHDTPQHQHRQRESIDEDDNQTISSGQNESKKEKGKLNA
ncbi:hypothetical protein NH340_JMT08571 [Sarcoptes scabiei]|nr:hypothetical protein NH340_JMT08571 [Sarcoptes scabiei]